MEELAVRRPAHLRPGRRAVLHPHQSGHQPLARSRHQPGGPGLPASALIPITLSDEPLPAMMRVRIDKWLWAARFFKSRALAARACDLGRILCNGAEAKPAREVHIGDALQIRNESGAFQVEILLLSEMRGPAATAQTLYRESDAS